MGDSLLNSCELYSPQEDRWYPLPPMKERRFYAAAASLPDGRVFVIGGIGSSDDELSSVEGSIFVAGGIDDNDEGMDTIEVFTPPNNPEEMGQWTTLTNSTVNGPFVQLVVWQERLFSFCKFTIMSPNISAFCCLRPCAVHIPKMSILQIPAICRWTVESIERCPFI
ncbi:unnamed protein product [Dibothriocephalus latus]|uniref:Kelch repeat protein n=1 Tax=Dibothriocephalus latus TaxID=60516 RepID=A0A3P7PA99_DIBLA|nr:unnamed protein product [Dibothriocephalus latus]